MLHLVSDANSTCGDCYLHKYLMVSVISTVSSAASDFRDHCLHGYDNHIYPEMDDNVENYQCSDTERGIEALPNVAHNSNEYIPTNPHIWGGR